MVGTWDRNIEPNFPAPISAARIGLPALLSGGEECGQVHGEYSDQMRMVRRRMALRDGPARRVPALLPGG